jgi:hypothetical protein
MSFETPYEQYQAKGYSAKQTFATVFGGIIGVGAVLIAGFIVIKFISALDTETLKTFSVLFFGIILGLLSIGGALGLVTIFRYIQKPGVQMPGFLGKLEERLEGKR